MKAGKESLSNDCCIFIMSYDLAQRRASDLQARKFRAIIADEAHYLKS